MNNSLLFDCPSMTRVRNYISIKNPDWLKTNQGLDRLKTCLRVYFLTGFEMALVLNIASQVFLPTIPSTFSLLTDWKERTAV